MKEREKELLRNIALVIAYEGVLSGWQRQKNAESIQEYIERAIGEITREEISLTASGRTDAGVHALGQVACFKTAAKIPVERLPQAINSKLPREIAVQAAYEMPPDFHPRYDALRKTYLYRIWNGPVLSPLERRFFCHERLFLDTAKMRTAAAAFLGEHDFTSFCSSHTEVENKRRRIDLLRIDEEMLPGGSSLGEKALAAPSESFPGKKITIEIRGNGFLYNMVRIIAGTLMEIGRGREYDIAAILQAKDRNFAGPTAKAQGLCLKSVEYGEG